MSLFHVLDDVFVVLRSRKGVYRQAKVYTRGETVYAGYGGGFVRLHQTGTSAPDISWSDLSEHPAIRLDRVRGPVFSDNVVRMEAAE